MSRYYGYKIKTGDLICGDYLSTIFKKWTKDYKSHPWVSHQESLAFGWDDPICSLKVYNSDLFQELIRK